MTNVRKVERFYDRHAQQEWDRLAAHGYHVTLVDLVHANLALARRMAAAVGGVHLECLHGNALDLSQFASARYNAVLLLGPLYHLLTLEERTRAVREAVRVLRPGGILGAAFLNRYFPIMAWAKTRPELLRTHGARVEELLATGVLVLGPESDFTDSYFAHPAAMQSGRTVRRRKIVRHMSCRVVATKSRPCNAR